MTMIDIQAEPVLRMLDKAHRRLAPPSLLTYLETHVHPMLVERIEDRFQHQGDDVSGPWAPLEASTMMIRMQQGYAPTPTNVRSGEMLSFLTHAREFRPMATGAEMSLPGTGARTSKMTNKLRVAAKGGTAPNAGKDTPPRPVLGLGPRDLALFTTSFEKWLNDAF